MSSLKKKKEALFEASSSGSSGGTCSNASKNAVKAALPKMTGGKSKIPSTVVKSKTEEAIKLVTEGETYLKTSLFQWQPDYMGAAPKFEGAGNAYRAAGSMALAHDTMVRCSQAYANYGSHSSAANAMQNAAKMNTDPRKHFEDMLAAADLWGQHGDLTRMAQMYVGAAESEGAYETEKEEYLAEASNILIPFDSTDDALKNCDVKGIEVLKKLLKCHMTGVDKEKALGTARFLGRVSEAFGQDTLLWKCLASESALQLASKDVIAAEHTYIQEHLSKSGYGSSKEAEIIENLINAFKNSDENELHTVQKSPDLFYLDREAREMVLGLAISAPSQGPRPVSTRQVETELSEKGTGSGEGEMTGAEKEISMTRQTEDEDEDEVDLA